jgi:hypothetical protein
MRQSWRSEFATGTVLVMESRVDQIRHDPVHRIGEIELCGVCLDHLHHLLGAVEFNDSAEHRDQRWIQFHGVHASGARFGRRREHNARAGPGIEHAVSAPDDPLDRRAAGTGALVAPA